MDPLKDFISKHHHLFNQEPLPAGHQERFFQKLFSQSPNRVISVQRKPFNFQRLTGLAASIALLLISGFCIWKVVISSNLTPYTLKEHRIEAKILQNYQNRVNTLEQQIKQYASSIPFSDWEQIEDTLEFFAKNRDMLAESLPPETPFAIRLAALEDYYHQNLSGFQQIADLLAQNNLLHQ